MVKRAHTDKRPYVGDYGEPLVGDQKAAASFGMVMLALAIGFVIGALVWGVLWLSGYLTSLVWGGVVARLPWYGPVLVCGAGGLAIGLWTRLAGGEPQSLARVFGEVRQTGGYHVDSIGASVVGFLLPLAFGGAVGPEAGLTGIIAAACSWIGRTLKAAGLKAKSVADLTVSATLTAIFGTPLVGIVAAAEDVSFESGAPNPDDYAFRRSAKIVLYVAAAFGAVAGIALLGGLLGESGGLPRFDAVEASGVRLVWFVPCIAVGYVLTLVFFISGKAFGQLAGRFESGSVVKPVICGLVIGAIATQLPLVLFSGEEQAFELMEGWQALGATTLVATGFVKAAVIPFCISMGWRGGHFFPCIFAGIACGYGMALGYGVDPMLAVTAVTATFVAGTTRKPLLALALLFLCFPVKSIVWLGLACVIGAALPVPAVLLDAEGE